MALVHVAELNAYRRGDYDPPDRADDRLVVNMLRHEYTSYDGDQSEERYYAANEAIAAQYPWLVDECERQSAIRRSMEDLRREVIAHREMVASTVADPEKFPIGSEVSFQTLYYGEPTRPRVGVVVKVNRKTVKVQSDGKERNVPAFYVHPLPASDTMTE